MSKKNLVNACEKVGDFLQDAVHNSNQRYKTAESQGDVLIYFYNEVKGHVKSAIRGAVVGGSLGGLMSGDSSGAIYGAVIGSVLDISQNAIRLVGLTSMYKNNPERYYEVKKEAKEKLGWIN